MRKLTNSAPSRLRDRPLQREIERLMKDMPRMALAELLPRKLKAAGVEPKPELVEALTAHLLAGGGEKFSWDDGKHDETLNCKLTFDEDDFAALDGMIDRLAETFPQALDDASREGSKGILKTLTEGWPEEHKLQREEMTAFQGRLEQRWGGAFDGLRMLITVCHEIGSEAAVASPKTREGRARHGVLVRLHARGCQLASEIMTLMEGGYADGAMGRWRTLYEVGVVATLIAEWGDEAAERYIAHEIVESRKGMDDYERCAPSLGYPPLSKREKDAMLRQYECARTKYGKEFLSAYGWAGAFLTNKEPKFTDLELAAQQPAMRSFYRMASHPVHAGPKGITFQLGAMSDRSTVLAGASNAGFADPTERTAVSLVQLTMLMIQPSEVMDDLVALRCLVDLRDQIVRDAMAAHHTLARDEHALRARDKNTAPRWRPAKASTKRPYLPPRRT